MGAQLNRRPGGVEILHPPFWENSSSWGFICELVCTYLSSSIDLKYTFFCEKINSFKFTARPQVILAVITPFQSRHLFQENGWKVERRCWEVQKTFSIFQFASQFCNIWIVCHPRFNFLYIVADQQAKWSRLALTLELINFYVNNYRIAFRDTLYMVYVHIYCKFCVYRAMQASEALVHVMLSEQLDWTWQMWWIALSRVGKKVRPPKGNPKTDGSYIVLI